MNDLSINAPPVKTAGDSSLGWCLVGQLGPSEPARQIPIDCTPFRVGRRADVSLYLPATTISKVHAELQVDGDAIYVADLQSTNGTFLNGVAVPATARVREGDLVQFANFVFRVGRHSPEVNLRTVSADSFDHALELLQFEKLINQRAVAPHFQPIVELAAGATVGFEVLARSRLVGMTDAGTMFRVASQLNLEVELSEMLRTAGVALGAGLPGNTNLFLNTHPAELTGLGLLESLRTLRLAYPDQLITLEIHEAAVVNARTMREIRAALTDLDIKLAYDDFGAGQARLIELVEVSPDYLKFDMKMVRGIDTAPASRQTMLGTLVRMVHELGIASLAEGVESRGESHTCRDLGFQFGQGYFYARPAAASQCMQADRPPADVGQ